MATLEQIRQIRKIHDDDLRALPNVVGVGTGYRIAAGVSTGELVIAVHVEKKLPRDRLRAADIVPPTLVLRHGSEELQVKTDVVETGRFVTSAARNSPYATFIRPVPPGYDIGTDSRYGTLGVWVTDGNDNYLLGNCHVLMSSNSSAAQTVYQPGRDVSSDPGNKIAQTAHYVPLQGGGAANYVDAAIASVDSVRLIDPNYPLIGPLKGHYHSLVLGWPLRKVGATTGLTDGSITCTSWSGTITDALFGDLFFKDQVVITGSGSGPIANEGDSGAVWVTDDNYAGALHLGHAANSNWVAATPINWVMLAFKLTVINAIADGRPVGGVLREQMPQGISPEEEQEIIDQITRSVRRVG